MIIVSLLASNLYDIHKHRDNFLLIDNSIDNIIVLDKVFNLYLERPSIYKNFDEIADNITPYKDKYLALHNNPLLNNIQGEAFKKSLTELVAALEYKFEALKNITSIADEFHKLLQNIPLINQKLESDLQSIYLTISNIDKIAVSEIEKELIHLKSIIPHHKPQTVEADFLTNAQTVLEYKIILATITNSLQNLHIDDKIDNFNYQYQQYLQSTTNNVYLSITILSLLLVMAVLSSLYHEYRLTRSNTTLSSFKRAIEHSTNIVIITDEKKNIKYVNKAYTNSTGYTQEEAIGKKPRMLSAKVQSDEFYAELTATLNRGEPWHGELINMDKTGMLIYEKASIIPVFEDGKIIEYTAIKRDITSEKISEEKLKEKERLLAQQSKMASMGEMIENIAHQWRQPLNVISVAASGMLINRELGRTNSDKELKTLKNINESAQYLSQTITDFKDFFKEDTINKKFSIKEACKKTILLTESKFKNSNIEIISDMTETEIYGSHSQFTQIVMNFLSNSNDILSVHTDARKKLILINLYEMKGKAVFKIKDSGGGIPDKLIDRVFEPYFTTKHKAQGTGIGLYMSMEIVRKHLNGTMSVKNETFKYQGKNYTGACFTLMIPLDRREKEKKRSLNRRTDDKKPGLLTMQVDEEAIIA